MSIVAHEITGVVLAGGASTRMGTAKAQLTLKGSTLLARVLAAGAESGIANWLVVGGEEPWVTPSPLARSTRWLADAYPGAGPLGGVVTALEEVSTQWLLVLSCDLVGVDPSALQTLMAHADDTVDAVVPRGARLDVLHALYRTDAIRPIESRFSTGERRMHSLVDGIRVRELPLAEHRLLARSTRDVDTPDEFSAVAAEE